MLTTTPPLSQVQATYDSRPADRTPAHFTMKTQSRSSPGPIGKAHSRSLSQCSRNAKANKSTTPLSSPRAPYSVGQNFVPKYSPVRCPEARSPSPNYFGHVVESSYDPLESSGLARDTWSPSSSIKSFAAPHTTHISLECHPELEDFRRQTDINASKSIMLPSTHFIKPPVNHAPVRPRPSRWATHASDTGSDASFPRVLKLSRERISGRMDVDHDHSHDSAYVSSESKRNSESSLQPLQITNLPRFESPGLMDNGTTMATATMTTITMTRPSLPRCEEKGPRLLMMEKKIGPLSCPLLEHARPATLPPVLDAKQPAMVSAPHLKELMETVDEDRLLLLDIRASKSFGLSRIDGALNLCIPTTLLKRASYDIEKLTQMFQGDTECSKFATWREMEWIIVYDSTSSAVMAQNMIKKFTNGGYLGNVGILRGGFSSFQGLFPDLVNNLSAAEERNENSASSNPAAGFAPVIGGVALPSAAGNAFNPFFSNIRQNMDLADGVGQLDISWPMGLEPESLPSWLRDAAAKSDCGKKVSDKFLRIEREEQTRMQSAYAAFNQGKSGPDGRVRLSGVEKGGKNRYKDILPFEHARVRLQNKPEGSCDYVNASHLTSSRSNKRYIASQGPLPDTFEDFWSVVWDQDVRVIVMLTAEMEGGQTKCHSYWTGRDFGPIKVQHLSEKMVPLEVDGAKSRGAGGFSRKRTNSTAVGEGSDVSGRPAPIPAPMQAQTQPQGQGEMPFVIIRKFAMSHATYPFAPIREITHLHFPSWPDFGTPAQPSHLLELVELANAMQRSALPSTTTGAATMAGSGQTLSQGMSLGWNNETEADGSSRPMLVHCSAGCGRTGTFCTVDSVIDMLKQQRESKSSERSLPANGGEGGDVLMADVDNGANSHTAAHEAGNPFESSLCKPESEWLKCDSVDLIQETVEDFRRQRISMVQSLRQFVLCYETVLEWVHRANNGEKMGLQGAAEPPMKNQDSFFGMIS